MCDRHLTVGVERARNPRVDQRLIKAEFLRGSSPIARPSSCCGARLFANDSRLREADNVATLLNDVGSRQLGASAQKPASSAEARVSWRCRPGYEP